MDIVVQEEEVDQEGAEPKQEQWVLALEWGLGWTAGSDRETDQCKGRGELGEWRGE